MIWSISATLGLIRSCSWDRGSACASADTSRSKPTRGLLTNQHTGSVPSGPEELQGFSLSAKNSPPSAKIYFRGARRLPGPLPCLLCRQEITGSGTHPAPPLSPGPLSPARLGDSPVTQHSPCLSPPVYHPLPQRGEMVPLRQLNSCQRGGISACAADAENTSQRYFK